MDKQTKNHKCEFIYKSEVVNLHDVNDGWYQAKRVIIFCKNCGKVSHDQTNDNYSYSQDYKHET